MRLKWGWRMTDGGPGLLDLTDARAELTALAKVPKKKTLRDMVDDLAPEIEAARAGGATYGAVSASLAKSGITISAELLRQYWRSRRMALRAMAAEAEENQAPSNALPAPEIAAAPPAQHQASLPASAQNRPQAPTNKPAVAPPKPVSQGGRPPRPAGAPPRPQTRQLPGKLGPAAPPSVQRAAALPPRPAGQPPPPASDAGSRAQVVDNGEAMERELADARRRIMSGEDL